MVAFGHMQDSVINGTVIKERLVPPDNAQLITVSKSGFRPHAIQNFFELPEQ